MHLYGDEQATVAALPGADNWLLPDLSEAMVRFAVRHEFARTVEDVLARRSRALFLDARQSAAAAEQVATVLLSEGCGKPELSDYLSLAHSYTLKSVP
jgi:glycerol-3-phosphate dehydrogenase